MMMLHWCKTQVMCLLILIYIVIIYIRDEKVYNKNGNKGKSEKLFDLLLGVTVVAVLFDGITICTVNFTDIIPRSVNLVFHIFMFVSYVLDVALFFLYWVSVTIGIPKKKWVKVAYVIPCTISIFFMIYFLPELEFLRGKYTCYSMGKSVYVCFASIVIYFVLTLCVILYKHRYIPGKKKKTLVATLVF